MDYCHSCRRHLNGALACPGCGAPAETLRAYPQEAEGRPQAAVGAAPYVGAGAPYVYEGAGASHAHGGAGAFPAHEGAEDSYAHGSAEAPYGDADFADEGIEDIGDIGDIGDI